MGSITGSLRESQATGTVRDGIGGKRGGKRKRLDGESSMYSRSQGGDPYGDEDDEDDDNVEDDDDDNYDEDDAVSDVPPMNAGKTISIPLTTPSFPPLPDLQHLPFQPNQSSGQTFGLGPS